VEASGTTGRRLLLTEPEVVRIGGIATGGDGVGHLADGRVVFVPRTAVGDEVAVSIQVAKKKWARAWPVSLRSSSPDRVEPFCPSYAECGGCTLQHVRYEAQLEAKRAIVVEALRRVGGVSAQLEGVEPATEREAYRARATFHLRRLPGDRVVAGFHRWDRSARVVDLSECPILTPTLAQVWRDLRAAWGHGARRLPSGKALRLTLREVDEGAVLSIEGGEGPGNAGALLKAVPGLVAIWNVTPSGSGKLLGGERDAVTSFAGERYTLRHGAFLQVHRSMAESLKRRVVEALGPSSEIRRVIDAYGGAGTYARQLAHDGFDVTVIDSNASACRDARRAGLRVIEARVEEGLVEALPADAIIVNPPRAGLSAPVTDLLVDRGPDRMVYVSCDPATLARDLGRLGRYRVSSLAALDMFPQTAHVESVVTLMREKDDSTGPTR